MYYCMLERDSECRVFLLIFYKTSSCSRFYSFFYSINAKEGVLLKLNRVIPLAYFAKATYMYAVRNYFEDIKRYKPLGKHWYLIISLWENPKEYLTIKINFVDQNSTDNSYQSL